MAPGRAIHHRPSLRLPAGSWDRLGRAVFAALHDAGCVACRRGLGDSLPTIDLRQAILDQSSSHGVPAEIALAVAMRESGIQQWYGNGALVTGKAGEIGIFQLMPSTAAALGVDPADPLQNIQGGVTFLAQNFQQFGSWPLALAAYNWGPGNLEKALQSGRAIPSSVQTYVSAVLAGAGAAGLAASLSALPAANAGSDASAGLPTLAPIAPVASNLPLILVATAAAIWGVRWILD